ncbi:DUF6756 family protein [Psychrobacter aestuarii]|uniref:Uncharacterized protein n=1 Tax=Psychrobacter aestuarii TaxID=556327 RepID=A0ABN0VUS0_9GAMM|nr:DUF6756 family protein [Psychrobacter aestuarii]
MKRYPYINSNGKKRPQSKEWSDVRAEIMCLKTKLNLTDKFLRMLTPYEDYKGIEEQISENFLNIKSGASNPDWPLQGLVQEAYSVEIKNALESYLLHLVPLNEEIWFGVTETFKERSKIWFYEGRIEGITKILNEICFFDECYFVSKKYDWLIRYDRHDILMVTGKNIPEKLKAIEDVAKHKG